jgi:hypothetical protein
MYLHVMYLPGGNGKWETEEEVNEWNRGQMYV